MLLSWAVPKGPSLDPADKRLAMHVEDHPIEYGGFEGIIPAKQYGGGTVMLWDRGTWRPKDDPVAGYAKGHLKFELDGEKLKGGWTLVRTRGSKYGGKSGDKAWLLIKENDQYARPGAPAIVDTAPNSVTTGRSLEEIAAARSHVWHSKLSVKENVKAAPIAPARSRRRGEGRPAAPKRERQRAAARRRLPKDVNGAKAAKLPAKLSPMLTTLVTSAPTGDDWLHEIKYDGYRMLCRIEDGKARLVSRNGKDWTAAFAAVAADLAKLPVRAAWIDGEVVVLDAAGRTSFQALQNALTGTKDAVVVLRVRPPLPRRLRPARVALTDRKAAAARHRRRRHRRRSASGRSSGTRRRVLPAGVHAGPRRRRSASAPTRPTATGCARATGSR